MQLVLSNNRIISHGENFLAMGGVVINTETGARFENATIAECEGCPSDIDEVGYEYHAGVFKPCAPYGRGNNNGFFMEVCEECATPRNSGVAVKAVKEVTFSKIASAALNVTGPITQKTVIGTLQFPISGGIVGQYSTLRYKIKAGSYIKMFGLDLKRITSGSTNTLIRASATTDFLHFIKNSSDGRNTCDFILNFENDIVIPKYLCAAGKLLSTFDVTDGNSLIWESGFYTASGIPMGASSTEDAAWKVWHVDGYACTECDYHIVIDLEGRI